MANTSDLEIKKQELQTILGESPTVEIEHLQNWSTSRNLHNLLTVSPATLEEAQNIVKAAKKLKLQVRCGGSLHSWGPLFPDEGNILMRTKELHRHDGPDIELIKISDTDIRVNVVSGTTVEQLMEFELENKVNLLANVVLLEPTYGGIVGTGCHGVGWNYKTVSDFCVQMRVIDSNGELRTYSKEADADIMAAAQCHMGMFGIIYDLQLQVAPELIAHSRNDFNYTAGDIFYNAETLKEILDNNDSVEIFYWPYSSVGWIDAAEQITRLVGSNETLTRDEWDPKKDGCWVRKVNIPDQSTVDKEDLKHEMYYNYLDIRTWIESKISSVADNFIVSMPEILTPLAAKAAYEYAKETNNGEVTQRLAHAIHFRDNIGLLSVANTEWVFDTKEDCSNVMQAVQAVIEILQQEAEQGKFPLNLVIEMRWMSYSEAYLCPAVTANPAVGGSGHAVYIEILSYTNTPGWDAFCNKVVKEWQKIPGARPHWAKEWDNIEGIDNYLKKVWSKQIEQFKSALEKADCDPDGMFLNNRLSQLFFSEKTQDNGGKKKKNNCVLL